MEHAELAAAIRLLRSRTKTDLLNRRMDRPGSDVRGGICIVSRDAAREAPDSPLGCSMVSHSREFREEEKRFAEFEGARRILDRLAR